MEHFYPLETFNLLIKVTRVNLVGDSIQLDNEGNYCFIIQSNYGLSLSLSERRQR